MTIKAVDIQPKEEERQFNRMLPVSVLDYITNSAEIMGMSEKEYVVAVFRAMMEDE